ncbi:MAG TPA: hypothetical protein VN843_31475 [Anaerolineales bacterium]|nr:hypothetical protein [Anaerolineales bacterium]
MTVSLDSQTLESYVPVYDVIPEKWEDARGFVVEQIKKMSNAINIREIGWFLDEELLSGKSFIPGANNRQASQTGQNYRSILRKVVDFGALPNAGTKSVPHGITVTDNFTLTFMAAAATDPVGLTSIAIPHATPVALANNIAITLDATNVNITTGVNRSNFTRCFVTIEYLQEL